MVIRWCKLIVDIATGEVEDTAEDAGKNPAAVELGRKGGLKGGKARAESMTPVLFYNFGRPHTTLANPYPRTPAMAAGVADHVWTMTEIAALLD